jgi:hypothetical protein
LERPKNGSHTSTFYPDQGILLLATTKIYVWEMKEEADARI